MLLEVESMEQILIAVGALTASYLIGRATVAGRFKAGVLRSDE